MAISYKKQYNSEAEYMYDVAKSSDLFREDTYKSLLESDQATEYTYAIAGTINKTSDTFIKEDYDLLNDSDKYSYLINEYYVDKNSDEYTSNHEYFKYKVDAQIAQNTYDSLNTFEKTMNSIGTITANALNELFLGTVEGLIDAGATLINATDFAAKDTTGVGAIRQNLQEYSRAYTYLDKNKIWGVANDVVTGISKMAPLLIPYVGSAVYFTGMAGNVAEEAIQANPDINHGVLLGYTLGVTGVELATEKVSSIFFGGSVIDNLVFKTGSSKTGSWISKIGLDFLSEGFEESISEVANSLLYTVIIDPDAPLSTMNDILYAGLIGGLIGGVAAGGSIASTTSKTILRDGTLVDSKYAKQEGLTGTKLSKTQTINLTQQIKNIQSLKDTDSVADLQAKYKTLSLNEIQETHSAEYEQAIEQKNEIDERLSQSVLGLNKIMELAGVDGFVKALDLLEYSTQQRIDLVNNYYNKLTYTNQQNKIVSNKWSMKFPGSSINISENLNTTQQRLKDGLKNLYNIDVFFASIGESDGITKKHGLTLDEKTIILDINLTNDMSLDQVIETVVKEELVHTLQFDSGILDAKTINDLMLQFNALGGVSENVQLDEAYRNDTTLRKLSEAQAKALSEALLFDKLTVSRIFMTNNSTFNRVYKFVTKLKNMVETIKNKTQKDKVRFRQLLKTMDMYKKVVAENIGNEEDAEIAQQEMALTDEELQKLLDAYLPTFNTEHYIQLGRNYTLSTYNRKQAENLISNARKDINKLLPLSFRMIYNPDYYTEEFVQSVMGRDPQKDFRYNLQEMMITETGFTISQQDGCLMEIVDLDKVTSNEFDADIADLVVDSDVLNKYTSLGQIFNDTFVEKFITPDGISQLDDIVIKFVPRETMTSTQAIYERINKESNRPTITIYTKKNQTFTPAQAETLKHNIFHEVTHALADIQGLQNGTSPTYVKSALLEITDQKTITKLRDLLLTESFIESNIDNTDIMLDNIAYGIYKITDGEYAAESYKNSTYRNKDTDINLKAGSTMNRSGFRTDGLILYGYGQFAGIELHSPTIAKQKMQYSLKNLREAKDVVAFSKSNDFRNYMVSKGITDFEKAGFSYEFIDAMNDDILTTTMIWNMLDSNVIGSQQATDMVISWLVPENKSMTSVQDVNNALLLGIAYADVYGKIRLKNDPNYNIKKRHSYDQLEKFFIDVNSKQFKNPKYENLVLKESERIANLIDKPENTQIKSWLIKRDYGYSYNTTKKLMSTLSGYGINSKLTNISETSDSEQSILDTVASTDKTPEEALMVENTISNEINESSLEGYINTITTLKEQIGDSTELFKIRNHINDNKTRLKNKFGEEGYKQILNSAPEAKATYAKRINNLKKKITNKDNLSVVEQTILSENTSDFTPNEFDAYINRLNDIVNTSDNSAVKKPLVSPKKSSQVEKNKQLEVTAKDDLSTTISKINQDDSSPENDFDISRKFANAILLGDKTYSETQERLFSDEMVEYSKFNSTLEATFDVYFNNYINDSNVLTVYKHLDSIENDVIRESTKAMFMARAIQLGDFSEQTMRTIDRIRTEQVSLSGRNLSAQAKRVVENNPIKSTKQAFAKKGLDIELTDTELGDIFKDLENKNQRIKDLNTEIEALKKQIAESKELEDQMLMLQQKQQLINERELIEHGTNEELADFKLNQIQDESVDSMEDSLAIQKQIVNKMLQKPKLIPETSKGIKLEYDSNGNPIYTTELKRRINSIIKGLQSYRMWAMLSSPVTFVRNWMGNSMMRGLEKGTDKIEKLFYKQKNDSELSILSDSKSEITKQLIPLYKERASYKNEDGVVTNKEKYDSLDKEVKNLERALKGIEFQTNQLSISSKVASKETKQFILDNFSEQIEVAVVGGTEKYGTVDERTEHSRYEKETELKAKFKIAKENNNKFDMIKYGAQIYTFKGLESGFFGDRRILKTSITSNLANILESNVSYYTRQAITELEGLRERETINKNGLSPKDTSRVDSLEQFINEPSIKNMIESMGIEEFQRILKYAEEMAYKQYFKNSNYFSRLMYDIGKKNPTAGFLVSIIMPFPKVAANIMTMAYEYSPLGFFTALKKTNTIKKMEQGYYEQFSGFEKAEVARSMAKASVGTFMLIAGALAAALGLVDIEEDDYLGVSLNLGGVRVSLSSLAPSMTTFALASSFTWAWKNDKKVLSTTLSTLYDQTMLGNLDSIFMYGSLENWAINLPISWLSQYIPSVVKLVNNSLLQSPTKDKSGTNDNDFLAYLEKLGKTLASYVPGLSTLVPDKVNPYTGEKVYSTNEDNWFLNFIYRLSPLSIESTKVFAVEEEAKRLNTLTTGSSGTFTINGDKITLSGSDKETISIYRANYINNEYEAIVNGQLVTVQDDDGKMITTTYDKLSDEQKARVLSSLYSKATDISKIEYWTSQGNSYIVTDRDIYNDYRKIFDNIIYKSSWSHSKFIEG